MILSNWRINVRLNTIRIPNQNEQRGAGQRGKAIGFAKKQKGGPIDQGHDTGAYRAGFHPGHHGIGDQTGSQKKDPAIFGNPKIWTKL